MTEMNRLDPVIGSHIIEWFKKNQRILPWRETDDPYCILVSEVMLQQTQVSTVIPYYLRFIETLPTLEDLSKASDDTLYLLWEGLGYYSRVMRLRQFAIEVVDQYDGQIPCDKEKLIRLPGVGPYTCGAILSFAFNKREAAVDGNVKRVISRLLGDDRDITKMATTKLYTNRLEEILPEEIYPFNQGMIELGALVCKPVNPNCENCPIVEQCIGYKLNIHKSLPNKPKKLKQKAFDTPVYIIEDEELYLFIKRGSKGLLSHMWGLPILEENVDEKESFKRFLEYMDDILGIDLTKGKGIEKESLCLIGRVKHVFSHRIWNQHVYHIKISGLRKSMAQLESPETLWDDGSCVSLPTAFKKSLELLNE